MKVRIIIIIQLIKVSEQLFKIEHLFRKEKPTKKLQQVESENPNTNENTRKVIKKSVETTTNSHQI